MRPSQVRTRILTDHERLRGLVSEVENIAKRCLDGEEHSSAELRKSGSLLYDSMRLHLDFEDVLLLGALRDLGSLGEQRADDLTIEHREQRELLTYLLERLSDSTQPSILLVRDLLNFTSLLRDDMDAEESTVLTEGLLCDDQEAGATL